MTGRDQALADVERLYGKLKQAEADHDNGAAMLARYDMDQALERLHGTASVEEFGSMGVAPE